MPPELVSHVYQNEREKEEEDLPPQLQKPNSFSGSPCRRESFYGTGIVIGGEEGHANGSDATKEKNPSKGGEDAAWREERTSREKRKEERDLVSWPAIAPAASVVTGDAVDHDSRWPVGWKLSHGRGWQR
ncbi:hypothetical protein LR48_Vigan09g077700 [Vigna angularis]|uniref:Uncharacterized protein n=1 Tax=Phaseolus angularis TaxID=3914 RepID=A0A0L9VAT9_PHAAN|nr:hypothetical protein LR48_Vigan09g077700 [Vigna angularis]